MREARKKQQGDNNTNAVLIVTGLVVLLIMAAGAEGIHESFRQNPIKLPQVLRIYRLVCSFLRLGVVILVLVGLGAYGRLMAHIPVGWLRWQSRISPSSANATMSSLQAARTKMCSCKNSRIGDKKDMTDYAKRVISVCRLIPASPPSHATVYSKKRREMLQLVFSWSAKYSPCLSCLPYRDIEKVSADTSASLKHTVSRFRKPLTMPSV
jgi:hypothetical protein